MIDLDDGFVISTIKMQKLFQHTGQHAISLFKQRKLY
jgi:hypothetical protein